MVFSSFTFLFYFLPIFLCTYFITPQKYKNLNLFIFSLIFYAWGEPIYVILMLFSTINDFVFGKLIYKAKQLDEKKKAKVFLIISVIINLLLLSFFKYSDFFIMTINSILGTTIPLLNLPLPVGISFYTFQTMSYSVDIYRGISKPQKSIVDFGTYVTLFPQLIAGPIVTYNQVELELKDRKGDLDNGLSLFLLGLSKKVILANNVGRLWESLYQLQIENPTIVGGWLAIICFGFQIYFDFSGYSDMAIGLGKMLGFTFPENFNYPYLSKSITEFWRRWHISLGSWFREYVYIPLGGNKKGIKRQIINISIVWLLTGFWHGANYNFILWGVYFGIILILEKTFLLKLLNKVPKFMQHIYALLLIIIGWVFFAIEDMQKMFIYLKGMFVSNTFVDNNIIDILWNNKVMLILCVVCSFPFLRTIIFKSKFKNAILFGLFLISLTFLLSSSYNPFLYFRF